MLVILLRKWGDFAGDVDQHMAILPKVDVMLREVKIGYIQVGDAGVLLTKEQEELLQLIWKKRHLLMGKGNAPCLLCEV